MKYGFDNVSIKHIQEESGFTAGSIYYYFKDKDEILQYMVNKYLIASFHKMKEKVLDSNGSLMEKIEIIFNFGDSPIITEVESQDILDKFPINYREFWVMYTSIYHHHPEIRPDFCKLCDESHDFYYGLVQEAINKKEIRDDIDIEELIMFIKTILKGYLVLIVFQSNLPSEYLLKANMKLLYEAIKRR